MIDAQLSSWYARLAQEFGPLLATTPQARRERYLAINSLLRSPDPMGVKRSTHALELKGRNLRAELSHPGGTPGLVVFFHGGGWVVGNIESHRDLCSRIAARAQVAVLNVEYRLSPEHAYPAPVDDACDALDWACAHTQALNVDGARVAVAGDSAGAYLAAMAALHARDHAHARPPLKLQWLMYPTIDFACDTASCSEYGAGPGLTTADMRWYWAQFSPTPVDAASPKRAASHANLAPAHVITAGLDPLKDEGEAYAAQLSAAGVAVTSAHAPSMTHGFARLYDVSSAARDATDAAIDVLKRALA
jgi:acetyl esterase